MAGENGYLLLKPRIQAGFQVVDKVKYSTEPGNKSARSSEIYESS